MVQFRQVYRRVDTLREMFESSLGFGQEDWHLLELNFGTNAWGLLFKDRAIINIVKRVWFSMSMLLSSDINTLSSSNLVPGKKGNVFWRASSFGSIMWKKIVTSSMTNESYH